MIRALAVLLAGAGAACAGEPCVLTDGADSCTRFVACIGEEGRWLDGSAIGRGEGQLRARISDGVRCEGDWSAQGLFGIARARCSDGTTIDVVFTYQDSYTGTTTGTGKTSHGETVRSWSGPQVLDYLRTLDPEGRPNLPCTAEPLLLSGLTRRSA